MIQFIYFNMGSNRKYSLKLFVISYIFLCMLNVQAIDIDRSCPRMLHKVFNGYAPIGRKFNNFSTKRNNFHNQIIFFLIQVIKQLEHIKNFFRKCLVFKRVLYNVACKKLNATLHLYLTISAIT